jgi:hypothetical protein
MENKLEYSFDDEPVDKFSYDIKKKRIEVYFSDYFDEMKNHYFEIPCVFIIEDWEDAKSKIGDDLKCYDLDKHMGIFSMILYMKYNDVDELEMLVNTIDNRYITLLFTKPQISLSK